MCIRMFCIWDKLESLILFSVRWVVRRAGAVYSVLFPTRLQCHCHMYLNIFLDYLMPLIYFAGLYQCYIIWGLEKLYRKSNMLKENPLPFSPSRISLSILRWLSIHMNFCSVPFKKSGWGSDHLYLCYI